jgi:Holliday junction resolvase RusA-like endonuclease
MFMEVIERKYVINGDPTPLARPRYSVRSKSIFDPQKNQKLFAQITLDQQHNNAPKFEGPIHIEMIFYMPAPKHISVKRKKLLQGKYHIFRPDTDNCIKYVCDIAQKILFEEDCIVASISAYKVYDLNPRTEFIVKTLPEVKS